MFNVKIYEPRNMKDLIKMCDDTTTEIVVPTPKNWKCKIKDCPTQFLHKHKVFEWKDSRTQQRLKRYSN